MIEIERVQTGVRIEKRLLKVLKGLAELKDCRSATFGGHRAARLRRTDSRFPETLAQIAELNKIYGMTLRAGDSHRLREK